MRANVQIIRVPSIPHGTTVAIYGEPSVCTIWLLESEFTAEQAEAIRSMIKDERSFDVFPQLIAEAVRVR